MTDKYVVAAVKHTIDISNDTYSAAYNKFSQFVSENQSLDSIEANAPKAGYTVRDRKNVQNTEHYVAGIRATGNALKWIFEAEKGDVSQLYECGNNDHLLVVVMTGVNPVGYASLESVKEEIKAAVLADKKFAKISEQLAGVKNIDEAKGKGANVADVNQITFAAPVYVTSLGSSEPALSGAVSATKEGEFSGNVIKGNGGAYLFHVIKTQKREGVSYDEKKMVEQLEQQAAMAARNYMSELYMKSETVDKRYLFF
jgi:peptidyl-prolyl cis-trans isomerase D